jgi:hypothetical protein
MNEGKRRFVTFLITQSLTSFRFLSLFPLTHTIAVTSARYEPASVRLPPPPSNGNHVATNVSVAATQRRTFVFVAHFLFVLFC